MQPDGSSAFAPAWGGKRILLVDHCTLFRAGLKLLLQQFDPRLQVVQAADDRHALRWLRASGRCDLAVLVVALAPGCGLDGLRQMHLHWPAMPLLALLPDDAREEAAAALAMGAAACLAQSSTPAAFERVVFRLLTGSVDSPCREPRRRAAPAVPPGRPATCGVTNVAGLACQALHITPRQAAVLRLMCQGLSTKLICRELGLSEGTVKSHTHAVFRALSVSSRVQAVLAVGAWDWSA